METHLSGEGNFLNAPGEIAFRRMCARVYPHARANPLVGACGPSEYFVCTWKKKSIYVQLGQRESANTDMLKPTLPVLTALTHRSSQVELVGKGSRVRYGNGGVPLFLVWRLWKMSTLRFSFVHEAGTSFSLIIFKNTKILLDTGIVWMLAFMPKQGLW